MWVGATRPRRVARAERRMRGVRAMSGSFHLSPRCGGEDEGYGVGEDGAMREGQA